MKIAEKRDVHGLIETRGRAPRSGARGVRFRLWFHYRPRKRNNWCVEAMAVRCRAKGLGSNCLRPLAYVRDPDAGLAYLTKRWKPKNKRAIKTW